MRDFICNSASAVIMLLPFARESNCHRAPELARSEAKSRLSPEETVIVADALAHRGSTSLCLLALDSRLHHWQAEASFTSDLSCYPGHKQACGVLRPAY